MEIVDKLGGAIEAIRSLRGMSIEELAEKTKIPGYLFKPGNQFSFSDLELIAKALNVRPTFLILLDDKSNNLLVTMLQEAVIDSITKSEIDKLE